MLLVKVHNFSAFYNYNTIQSYDFVFSNQQYKRQKILIEFKLNVLLVMTRRPVLCYDACVQRSILAQSVTFYQYVTSQPETGFVSTHGFLEYEIFLSRVQ